MGPHLRMPTISWQTEWPTLGGGGVGGVPGRGGGGGGGRAYEPIWAACVSQGDLFLLELMLPLLDLPNKFHNSVCSFTLICSYYICSVIIKKKFVCSLLFVSQVTQGWNRVRRPPKEMLSSVG